MSEVHDSGRAAALSRLAGPAIGLIVLGALGLLSSCFGILTNLLGAGTSMIPPGLIADPDAAEAVATMMAASSGVLGVVLGLVNLLVSVVVIFGGIKMRTGELYPLAMTSAILAIVPCFWSCPCCCFGIPMGIWAVVVLLDNDVKNAFR